MKAPIASFESLTVSGTAKSDILSADVIRCSSVVTESLETSRLSSPTGTVIIEGDLKLVGRKGSASFLQLSQMHFGASRWRHVSADSFDSNISTDNSWIPATVSQSCKNGGNNMYLPGPCSESGSTKLSKVISSLPEHSKVRVTARVHFLDSWKGETVYLSASSTVKNSAPIMLWADSATAPSPDALAAGVAVDVCGASAPDARFSVPLDVSFDHVDEDLLLTFASTLTDSSCAASYGIDDVKVMVL